LGQKAVRICERRAGAPRAAGADRLSSADIQGNVVAFCVWEQDEMTRCRGFFAVTSATILAASLCGCAAYRKCGFSGCPGDSKITAEVSSLFNQYPVLEPPNVLSVQTLDRVVYLTGQVNTDTERDLANAVALRVAGVRRVINSINVSYQGR
jgi:hypothetical protein